jgi:hypothetical protein
MSLLAPVYLPHTGGNSYTSVLIWLLKFRLGLAPFGLH